MDLSLMNRSKSSGGELDSYEADAAAIRNSSRLSAFSSSSTDRMLELQHNFIPVAGYHQHQQQHQQQQLKSPIPTPGHFSSHQQHQHQQQHHQPLPPPPPQQQQQHHHLFPFTASQWSELEHQALIFKYMMARAPVPPELIIPIRRSLILSATSSAGWNGFQMGASPMDAEPGRCRRTDGKKWRCSRPVVADQKYCDRHMHRGRNRSRKAAQAAAAKAMTAQQQSPTTTTFQQHQQHPPIPSFEQQPADDRSRGHQSESEYHHQPVKSLPQADQVQRKTPEALRHFFDDWPRESKEQTSSEFEASMQNNARRNGLIFPPLKLALDDHDTDDPYTNISLASVPGSSFVRSRHPWFTDTPGNPLGGPLAEALQNPGSASASKSQSQIKPVGFNLLDSQLSSRKQQQNIVASPTGVLQKIACFSDCSSSASSPGSIRTDNIPHSLAQVE